jgi:hypothetical protein
MSRLVLDPFSLLYVLQVLCWEDIRGSCYSDYFRHRLKVNAVIISQKLEFVKPLW